MVPEFPELTGQNFRNPQRTTRADETSSERKVRSHTDHTTAGFEFQHLCVGCESVANHMAPFTQTRLFGGFAAVRFHEMKNQVSNSGKGRALITKSKQRDGVSHTIFSLS
jgi:hypothetical protein